jgi:hypothetical protein
MIPGLNEIKLNARSVSEYGTTRRNLPVDILQSIFPDTAIAAKEKLMKHNL